MDIHLPDRHSALRDGNPRSRVVEQVFPGDADHLAGAVDFPASENGPLFRSLFPRPDFGFSEQQKDEIVRWYSEGIGDAVISGRTYLRKIRSDDETVVGLAAWVVTAIQFKQEQHCRKGNEDGQPKKA